MTEYVKEFGTDLRWMAKPIHVTVGHGYNEIVNVFNNASLKQNTGELDIVVPIFNNYELLEDFLICVDALVVLLAQSPTPLTVNVLLVDDGSEIYDLDLRALIDKPFKVSLISHTKNYGQHEAILTGMRHSIGNYFVRCNLDQGELLKNIPNMVQKMLNEGSERCLLTVNENTRASSKMFSVWERWFFGVSDPKNHNAMRLLSPKMVSAICSVKTYRPYSVELENWTGFRTSILCIDSNGTKHRNSSYSTKKRVQLFGQFFPLASEKLFKLILILFLATFSFCSFFGALLIVLRIKNVAGGTGFATLALLQMALVSISILVTTLHAVITLRVLAVVQNRNLPQIGSVTALNYTSDSLE